MSSCAEEIRKHILLFYRFKSKEVVYKIGHLPYSPLKSASSMRGALFYEWDERISFHLFFSNIL